MQIALYNRTFEKEDLPFFDTLLRVMRSYQIHMVFYKDFAEKLQEYLSLDFTYEVFDDWHPIPAKVKFLFSLGGDGTMLDVVKYVAPRSIPVLGINLGRLGFLAATKAEEIDFAVDSLLKGAYLLDTRSLIHVDSSVPVFEEAPFALNEFSIHRKDSSSLIKIHTYLNGEFMCTYWADGIIVSTPTGSTGYSLSCGGPVIFPQSHNFVITAVAPHNLNVRPVIVPDTSIISFDVEGRADYFLCTLDARTATIDHTVSLAVKKENFDIHLIRLEGQNFLNTLRSKLFWGVDHRN